MVSSRAIIDDHRAAGRRFAAGGLESFVLEHGTGVPVLCIHGVPTSSFLYRKVLTELAALSCRGVAFDLPGLGLADRPRDFDYSWSGLGRFCAAAVDALSLEEFHLVVHDIGGPVGFELAAAMPDRVRSLTVLNTVVRVASFRRPWSMEPFARPGIGEVYLRMLSKPAFRLLMRLQGVENMHAVTPAELDAYVDLLKLGDGGRAFLKIMRGLERTPEKQRLYESVLGEDRYPIKVVWGTKDPALSISSHGEQVRRAAGVAEIHPLTAKHFLQEDQAPALAAQIARLTRADVGIRPVTARLTSPQGGDGDGRAPPPRR